MPHNVNGTVVTPIKRCVLVLGSHRSGTSVLTRALLTVGVFLGNDFYEPQYDNPKGFFEDKTTHQLNEAFLNRIDRRWNSLLLPDSIEPEDISAYQNSLKNKVFSRFESEPLWGLKEPRISRLWPYWLPVFVAADIKPVFILANRHPLSVASSLFKRDQMPEAQALALWAIHQLDAMEALLQHGGLVVDYDLLMDKPRKELLRIASFLGVGAQLDPDEVTQFESEFLADNLRHSRFPIKTATSTISQLGAVCLDFYTELYNLAQLSCGLPLEGVRHEQARTLATEFRNKLTRSIDWLRAIDTMQAALEKISTAQSSAAINAEYEARLYLSELVDGRELTYAKFRSSSAIYHISSQQQTLHLSMPADLMPLARIRLDPANRPVALVLHRLALIQSNGTEQWRWNGGVEIFVAVAGLALRNSADGMLLLALNDKPRLELDLPEHVLSLLTADSSLVVELTARPLLEVFSKILNQNDRLIDELRADLLKPPSQASHSLPTSTIPASLPLSRKLENITSLLTHSLNRRDQTIAHQAMQLKSMREKLLRAEAQLDLLKNLLQNDEKFLHLKHLREIDL